MKPARRRLIPGVGCAMALAGWLGALGGCAFFYDVNRLGADLDIGLGGGALAAAIGDVHVKGSLAIERRESNAQGPDAGASRGDRGFL